MLVKRLQGSTANRMPPIGSSETDPAAIQLVTDWINQSLPSRQSFAQWQSANSVPATGDTDNDGCDNRMEFLTHTDPNSNADSFKPGPLTVNSQVQFQFVQPANRTALVETSTDLQTWTHWDVIGNTPTYPAFPTSRTLTAPADSQNHFYRILFNEP
jgi:hypothetical protein